MDIYGNELIGGIYIVEETTKIGTTPIYMTLSEDANRHSVNDVAHK